VKELQPGTILQGRYRIARQVSRGGFGIVYRAWDMHLTRAVALKQNLDNHSEAIEQFKREAEILKSLRHPNLPYVYDDFQEGNASYLVMEFIEGENLHQRIENEGAQKIDTVIAWLTIITDAVAYLHGCTPPVIHRDIKPKNLILTPENRLVLVDFGISKMSDPLLRTATGARAGSPPYSPPEQYGALRTDQRSDLYALAATVYTLLAGFEPPDAPERTMGTAIQPINVPESLFRVVLKGMALKMEDRFSSVREFSAACQAAVPQQQTIPKPLPVQQVLAPQVMAHAGGGKALPFVVPEASRLFQSALPLPAADLFTRQPKGGVYRVGGYGGYATIQSALYAAPENARIFIKPGTYRESLKVEKAVQLVPDGPVGSVMISAQEEDVMYINCDGVELYGITLSYSAGAVDNPHQRGSLHIAKGNATFVACQFQTDWQINVNLHHPNTKVVFVDCTFSGGAYAGISVTRGAQCRMMRCRVMKAELGCEVNYKKSKEDAPTAAGKAQKPESSKKSRAWLDQVTFENCPHAYVVADGAEMTVRDVRTIGDLLVLAQARTGSQLYLFDTTMQNQTVAQPVIIFGKSKASLVNCHFSGIRKAPALAVGGGSQVVVKQCMINNNDTLDLHVYSGAEVWSIGGSQGGAGSLCKRIEPGAALYD